MAPFIKYTRKLEFPDGPVTELCYINAEHISTAVYNPKDEALRICGRDKIDEILTGDEAKEALEILQKL